MSYQLESPDHTKSLQMQVKDLLKIKEAAALLNLSEHTLRMWIWQKRIPSIKLGRSIRLKRSDIEQLIHANRREPVDRVAL
jgi:excisionase family DNA binding protein